MWARYQAGTTIAARHFVASRPRDAKNAAVQRRCLPDERGVHHSLRNRASDLKVRL